MVILHLFQIRLEHLYHLPLMDIYSSLLFYIRVTYFVAVPITLLNDSDSLKGFHTRLILVGISSCVFIVLFENRLG